MEDIEKNALRMIPDAREQCQFFDTKQRELIDRPPPSPYKRTVKSTLAVRILMQSACLRRAAGDEAVPIRDPRR